MNNDRRAGRELISVDARIRVYARCGEEVDLLGEGGRRLEIAAVLVNGVVRFVPTVDRAFSLGTCGQVFPAGDELGSTPGHGLLRLRAKNARLVHDGNAGSQIVGAVRILSVVIAGIRLVIEHLREELFVLKPFLQVQVCLLYTSDA